jgi:prepilin-type N-terminal cleavage/methylation domain-containing protein
MIERSNNIDRPPSNSGFTMAELMIVLLISLVLALISLSLYNRAARRQELHNNAVALASRLEQIRALSSSHNTEYRLVFNELSSSYMPQFYNREIGAWDVAQAISSQPLELNVRVSFGAPTSASSPPYRSEVVSITEPVPDPPDSPSGPSAVQFNTRGFPVHPGDSAPNAGNLRADNAIYLTDGRDYFAVTVNLLGQVQVWSFAPTSGSSWRKLSQ